MTIEEVFAYIKNSTGWADSLDDSAVFFAAENFCKNINNYTKQKTIFRICGQSGCGKTTQGCSSIKTALEAKGKTPLIIGVRTFASFHPNYEALLQEFGKEFIREKTNGFALKCLFASFELLAKKGILIVLDLTLLHPILEAYFAEIFTKYGFDINICLFAVNKKISNSFILKRKNDQGKEEKGRIVYKSSSDFFYKILPKGLNFLIKNYPNLTCEIWNVFNKNPEYSGTLSGCKKTFLKNRHIKKYLPCPEETLLNAKIKFYSNIV